MPSILVGANECLLSVRDVLGASKSTSGGSGRGLLADKCRLSVLAALGSSKASTNGDSGRATGFLCGGWTGECAESLELLSESFHTGLLLKVQTKL